MARRSYRPDEIIKRLRGAEVLLSQGSSVGEAARKIGVTEQTHYRWRREYRGMRIEQVSGYQSEKRNYSKVSCLCDSVLKNKRSYGTI